MTEIQKDGANSRICSCAPTKNVKTLELLPMDNNFGIGAAFPRAPCGAPITAERRGGGSAPAHGRAPHRRVSASLTNRRS
ncbi:hypothetical protein EVAR_99974_1 [Eumeta japonica]|uniref:Uncharacterized protein n=1 Tax=Eumeta variegata TaxID=151549 RepID=A0A4C1ZGX2_EUMVA|nr:hypothetical protein EVAR_99974_1 [Eumeta japonica]